MRFWMTLAIFFLLGGFFIISNHNLALSEHGNAQKFFSLYSAWVGHLFDNVVGVTGYVVKFDWLPAASSSGTTTSEAANNVTNNSSA